MLLFYYYNYEKKSTCIYIELQIAKFQFKTKTIKVMNFFLINLNLQLSRLLNCCLFKISEL